MNEENLTPWPKGVSGNPNGRPKTKPFLDALKAEIEEAGNDKDALRLVARALLNNALKGDNGAIQQIADRFDGKPTQTVAGDEDNPLRHVHEIRRSIVDPRDTNSPGIPPAP